MRAVGRFLNRILLRTTPTACEGIQRTLWCVVPDLLTRLDRKKQDLIALDGGDLLQLEAGIDPCLNTAPFLPAPDIEPR